MLLLQVLLLLEVLVLQVLLLLLEVLVLLRLLLLLLRIVHRRLLLLLLRRRLLLLLVRYRQRVLRQAGGRCASSCNCIRLLLQVLLHLLPRSRHSCRFGTGAWAVPGQASVKA